MYEFYSTSEKDYCMSKRSGPLLYSEYTMKIGVQVELMDALGESFFWCVYILNIVCSNLGKPQKNAATKLEGGGGKAFVAGPLKKELFCSFP